MAGPDAVSTTPAAPASPAGSVPTDPLDAARSLFSTELTSLMAAAESPAAETGTTLAADSAPGTDAPLAAVEQSAEQADTPGTDTTTTPAVPAAAPGEPPVDAVEAPPQPPQPPQPPPLKPRDEATLAALREKDPAIYQEVRRLLQGVGDRATQQALALLKREQSTTEAKQSVTDTGMQDAYEAMAEPIRAAWIETLPEYQAGQRAIASDFAGLFGIPLEQLTPEAMTDFESLPSLFLAGPVAQAHLAAAVKVAAEKAAKEADQAGYLRGKAEIRGINPLPQAATQARPAVNVSTSPNDAAREFLEALASLAAA